MTTHLETNLQKDIDQLRQKVLDMGELVENALRLSLQAINDRDRRIAYSVILRDRYIDELERELDQLSQKFLIRQQPVAGNLRLVYAVIKINSQLERVGDYAESISRQFLTIGSVKSTKIFHKINELANLAIPMLRNAITAFKNQDSELAWATKKVDNKVDDIRYSFNRELIELHEKGEIPPDSLPSLMIIGNRLERVADQSCNICEEVLYMTTGENVKHKGKEVFRVLFVDERDACRGQIAEGIGNSLGLDRFYFSSAGVQPKPIDPYTIKFMAQKGIDISTQSSKYLNQILNIEDYSVIVSLCPEAEIAFPPPPSKTVAISWNIQDPSKVTGSEEEINAAYELVYQYLDSQIRDLVEAIIGNQNIK